MFVSSVRSSVSLGRGVPATNARTRPQGLSCRAAHTPRGVFNFVSKTRLFEEYLVEISFAALGSPEDCDQRQTALHAKLV